MKPARLSRIESIRRMNALGKEGKAFHFLISYAGEHNLVLEESEAPGLGFHLNMQGLDQPLEGKERIPRPLILEKVGRSESTYRNAFEQVKAEINYGNSFLLNLTCPTRVHCNYSMEEMYRFARAPFKLFIENQLVIFSPERFVRIRQGQISSHPMKGTIDASIPGAHALLSSDRKEDAEHTTIVDLIRNDLSMVARDVRVKRFKYIDRVRTHRGVLLQMSSEITGTLPGDFQEYLGELLFQLLPAGSISGAPKAKTMDIIHRVEGYERGDFTGIFGHWDGRGLDSAVAIRYLEKSGEDLVFKSGGGITFMSECRQEYQEMLEKVYVPIY